MVPALLHNPSPRRVAAAILTALCVLLGPVGAAADAPDEGSAPRSSSASLEETADDRVDALVDRAREADWSADRLFEHLDLDDLDGCLHFADRSVLRERRARWGEAVELLSRIDPEALRAWLLGEIRPPDLARDETRHQLRCLFRGLVDAVGDPHRDVRLFLNVRDHFDGRFANTERAAAAARRSDYWFDRLVDALTRSTFRTLGGQASIWKRKFYFTGRAFNRISEETARQCPNTGPGLWNPDHPPHRHCWHRVLSAPQRERQILQASAAPGLSRHHWGTDVDVLSLNPANFREAGPLHGDWEWLDDHGLDYGFFQTYRQPRSDSDHAHMRERWHWSYYPVAQALWNYIRDHSEEFRDALFERWDRFEARWRSGPGPYFDYLRDHWESYVFDIHVPDVRARPSPPPPADSGVRRRR